MRKFAVEGDNSILDCLDVAPQHSAWSCEPRNCTLHSVEVMSFISFVIEKCLPALVVPKASNMTVTLVVPVNMQPALYIPAQLNGGACDGILKVLKFQIKQDESRQAQQVPGAVRDAVVCRTGD